MIYAMSDIHGEYEKYKAMLEKIHFSQEDTLYILGDVVDRGEHTMELLQDLAGRANVYTIMGNHEALAISVLKKLLVEIEAENCETHLTEEDLHHIAKWQMDGGGPTIAAFQAMSRDMQADLYDFLSDFALYETVDAGERTFILVHAGLQNFAEDRPLRSYSADELVWERPDFHRRYFSDPNIFMVVGHTPTLAITGKAEIYHEANNICIDCGASFPNGRLACLCLDTMQEFYV